MCPHSFSGDTVETPLFRPIPVKYTGLYSDDHLIDLQEFGISLQGLAKLSNSVVNFYLNGEIIRDSRLFKVRLFAAPPEPCCVILDVVALMVAGQLPLWAPLICETATGYLIPLLKGIIAKRLKRPDVVEAAVAQMAALALSHAEFAKEVHQGHMRDKEWLYSQIDSLAKHNAAPLRQFVKPIGSTCHEISLGSEDSSPAKIGEAEAQALTSKEELSVDDSREFKGVFEGVDTTNGTCKFRIDGSEGDVSGKITDPALLLPQNPYTHSLDTKKPVTITAKAVTRDGDIVRLFISDGR
jgi:hypothetical protein